MMLSLGRAPASGGDGVWQCNAFKLHLRNKIGRDPADAYLHMATDEKGGCEMRVIYEPEGLDWAKKAKEWSEWVWEQIKTEPKRVMAR